VNQSIGEATDEPRNTMPIAAFLQVAAALVGPSSALLRIAAPSATRLSGAVRHPAVRCAGSPASTRPPSQLWGPVIQGPFGRLTRATVRRELVRGRIWSFEQVQGLLYVHVPVRMTAVRLDSGGLLLYSAVAPTAECLSLLAEVEAQTGPVEHILLPSLALEHKTYAADFGRARPAATVWVVPDQYTFPLSLPLSLQVPTELHHTFTPHFIHENVLERSTEHTAGSAPGDMRGDIRTLPGPFTFSSPPPV
jgi:hypothetical protein